MNESMNTLFNEALIILNNLHFLRADWFYAFIPLFLFLLLSYTKSSDNKNWRGVIDPQLQPFVLSKSTGKQRRYPLLLVFIAASLCITALAGPVYKKLPQPVYREQSSLVVLLDLSQSMNATDIKPSRLARAKLELLDLLKARKTGQTALIVYAADAFVVTPLTDDNATIANLVPALETDMMPAQGSNLAKALAKTVSLFTQSGVNKGDILVITDDIHQRDESAIKKIVAQGYRLSIFGIGTTDGGPIPLSAEAGGGFLQDSHGAIVIPKLQPGKLQRFALSGGGLYTSLQPGDEDVNKLSALFQSSEIEQQTDKNSTDKNKNLNADLWQEEGHWLLLPLLFFAALWARRGWLAVILVFMLPLPQPAYADGIDTEHLWLSPDQKAMRAFNKGDLEQAAKNFTDPQWKASALYRKGDYEAAAKTLEQSNSSDGNYNKGNALAKQGKLDEAIKAYDKALELDENNADARYNREQVKQALEKQQKQEQKNQNGQKQDQQDQQQKDGQKKENQQQQGGEKQQDQKSQDSQQQNSEQQKNKQQNDQQQNAEQQNQQQDSQQSENQSSEKSEDKKNSKQENKNDKNQQQQSTQKSDSNEQQQAEQEQLKQRDAKAEAEQQKKEAQQYQKNLEKQKQEQDASQKDQPQKAEQEVEHKNSKEKPMEVEVNPVEASISEEEKATEQWLKRVPDDPGGLLRRKFYYQYKQLPNQNDSEQPW